MSFRIKTKTETKPTHDHSQRGQPGECAPGEWGPQIKMASSPQGRHVLLRGSQALAAPNPFPASPFRPPAQPRIPPWLRVPVPRRCVCPARLRKLPTCSSLRGAGLRVRGRAAIHRRLFWHQLQAWPSRPSRKRAEAAGRGASGAAGRSWGGQGRRGQRLPWTEAQVPDTAHARPLKPLPPSQSRCFLRSDERIAQQLTGWRPGSRVTAAGRGPDRGCRKPEEPGHAASCEGRGKILPVQPRSGIRRLQVSRKAEALLGRVTR